MPIVAVISNQYGLTRDETKKVRPDVENNVKTKFKEVNGSRTEAGNIKGPERK